MTDEELTKAVAQKVMEWKWMRWEDYRKLHEKNPEIADEYKGLWVWVTKDNKLPTPRGEFNLNDPRHWMMVVQKLTEKYDVSINWYLDKGELEAEVVISLREDDPRFPKRCYETGDEIIAVETVGPEEIGLAIYKAALKAEGGDTK